MKNSYLIVKSILITLTLTFSLTSFAGGGRCNQKEISKAQLINGGLLASKVSVELERLEKEYKKKGLDLKVVVIARQGTDPGSSTVLVDYHNGQLLNNIDEYAKLARTDLQTDQSSVEGHNSGILQHEYEDENRQLKYSHLGLAFKNHPKGKWGFVHELNPCQTQTSNLYDEDLWTFFLDDPYEYGAAVFVPTPELQQRLEETILEDEMSMNFHGDVYNALSLPFSTEEQNSNQWALEVIASAMRPRGKILERHEAQHVLYHTGYRPTRMITGFYHSLGMMFGPDSINFKPHKYSSSLNLIEVITVLSIKEFMLRNHLIDDVVEVSLSERELIIDDITKKKEKKSIHNTYGDN